MSSQADYWVECIAIAAEECKAHLTDEQLKYIASSAESGHDNYGMAFYSPPSTDRINDLERQWKGRLEALQREFDDYRGNAETAVKRALRQSADANVSIGKHGEVIKFDGRTTVIQ